MYNRITTSLLRVPIFVVSPQYETLRFKVSSFWDIYNVLYFLFMAEFCKSNLDQQLLMTEILLTSWPFIPLLVFGRISAINCHQAVNLRLFCKTPTQKKKKRKNPKNKKMKQHSSHLTKSNNEPNCAKKSMNHTQILSIIHSSTSFRSSKKWERTHQVSIRKSLLRVRPWIRKNPTQLPWRKSNWAIAQQRLEISCPKR